MSEDQRMRSPLGRALGLGSAKEGVAHWWAQRVTAVALIPLALWFVAALVALTGADRGTVAAWLREPFPAIVTVLLLIAGIYHMSLGIQVVIEDYVHGEAAKIAAIVLNKLAAFAIAAAGIFAVLRIAFQG
ncbi:MAG TPA: succinate dehydrogenase, hydrophobic membrane anchor protein [Stellaceae bacterium]|nr:succinate dehydrogenase, hydrophobic membrane anchor protein [Stellaceae bacterium]